MRASDTTSVRPTSRQRAPLDRRTLRTGRARPALPCVCVFTGLIGFWATAAYEEPASTETFVALKQACLLRGGCATKECYLGPVWDTCDKDPCDDALPRPLPDGSACQRCREDQTRAAYCQEPDLDDFECVDWLYDCAGNWWQGVCNLNQCVREADTGSECRKNVVQCVN